MWIIHFLPDAFLLFVVNVILIAGIFGCIVTFFFLSRLLRFFPALAVWHTGLQVASVLLFTLGVYFRGGLAIEEEWRARVAEVEAKVAAAEAKSQEANVVIEKKVVTKIKTIKERGQIVRQYVDREIVKYDNTCVIPKEFVKAHNSAALNQEIK